MDAQKRIRELMAERGWTDYRLAKESGLSHSRRPAQIFDLTGAVAQRLENPPGFQPPITNMFNRNNAPTLPTLEAVCAAMGITLAQFFADGPDSAALTEEQRSLFAKWSTLTDKQKEALLRLIDAI